MNKEHRFHPGRYFTFSIVVSIWITSRFLHPILTSDTQSMVFWVLLIVTYGVMYQLPAILGYWIFRRWSRTGSVVAISLSLALHCLLYGDFRLFDLYGFHINGFVWNLLTTPGGLDSLGADQSNLWPVLGLFFFLALLHIVFALAGNTISLPHPRIRNLVAIFFLLTVSERLIYAVESARLDEQVLEMADALPLYQPLSMRGLLRKLGVEVKKRDSLGLRSDASAGLNYPRHPLNIGDGKHLDIVILVAESLRWDMLTPEIMPNTWAISNQAWRFENHYSGGNGTREGLFGLFYGLYGNYWDRFLQLEREPVLFDVLDRKQYTYFVHTSAKFSYPEFDRTIFRSVPDEDLHEVGDMIPWQRDIENTDRIIAELSAQQAGRPTFTFMFFESTHARYYFPDDSVVEPDYLANLDYANLSREQLLPQIGGMKGRYINAAHHVDTQIGRLIDYLKNSGRLDRTLIVITGDHGEEFMENGRWGHNSAFTEQQVRTPMVIHIPGEGHRVFNNRTSHLDIPPTILAQIGLENPTSDYALGYDLSRARTSDVAVVASWNSIGIINDSGKLVVPFKSTSQHRNLSTTLDDRPVDPNSLISQMSNVMPGVIANTRSFLKRNEH